MTFASGRNGLRERSALFIRILPRTEANREDIKQLVRSSGSVAANQIEADDALGDKDRVMKFRICRKESRESALWLRLLFTGDVAPIEAERVRLADESLQLARIYSTIITRLGA
jgi:four helix bundle protein